MRELKDLVDVAAAAARRAADYLRTAERPVASTWDEKDQNDFVTEVDRRSEAIITEALTSRVPGSCVVGEELAPGPVGSAGVVWIVDPLDGTTNFLHGYPQYAVSIAAVVDGVLSVGVVHDVPRGVVYRGARGQGAWRGEERLRVSSTPGPRGALIGTGFPYKRLERLDVYLRQLGAVIREATGIRRAGSASLDLADVAAGRFDAFWELLLAPWDVAAGTLLVREAGGVVTTLEGGEDILQHGSIVAGNPGMHRWLIDLLRSA